MFGMFLEWLFEQGSSDEATLLLPTSRECAPTRAAGHGGELLPASSTGPPGRIGRLRP